MSAGCWGCNAGQAAATAAAAAAFHQSALWWLRTAVLQADAECHRADVFHSSMSANLPQLYLPVAAARLLHLLTCHLLRAVTSTWPHLAACAARSSYTGVVTLRLTSTQVCCPAVQHTGSDLPAVACRQPMCIAF
jgi:hypothetical protein